MVCTSTERVADRQLSGGQPKTQHTRGQLKSFFTIFTKHRSPHAPQSRDLYLSSPQVDRAPSLLASPIRKLPEIVPQEAQSPAPSLPEPHEAPLDEGTEGEGTTEAPSALYHAWIKSPERGGLSFSPINSNLRDLTPSHTLDMGAFSEAMSYYPCTEEGGNTAFTRSLSGDAAEGAGTAQNPPQKKKVRS